MDIEFAESTQIGNRSQNQDAYRHVIQPDFAFFVLADGLGGHEAGELAAQGFCKLISDLILQKQASFKNSPYETMAELIRSATEELCKDLFALNHPGSRTTCAVVYLDSNQMVAAHIGDSRIYRFTDQKLVWRSTDHSLLQQLIDTGQLSTDQPAKHPAQTMLLRTVSCYEFSEPDIYVYRPLEKNELVLLCSDGFWEYAKLSEMQTLDTVTDLQKAVDELVTRCVERGSPAADNTTVQVIRIK